MQEIEYPFMRINSSTWTNDEALFPLFDEYMYSSKEQIFQTYYFDKEFIDSKGTIFKVVGREPTQNIFRKWFNFLPGVYREKLVYKKIAKKIELNDFKEDVIRGIKRFNSDATKEISIKWIDQIRNAKDFGEVINGENK